MSWQGTVISTTLALIVFSAALTENAAAQVPIRPGLPPAPGTTTNRPRREPCWQVAGISRSAMQQRRALTRQARQEVEAVCANSSLSAQQKQQQIQQIHQRERQQVEALITPAQQEAMRACQQGRGVGHGGGHIGGGGGPCGEISTGHKANPRHANPNYEEDEMPPDETPKPN